MSNQLTVGICAYNEAKNIGKLLNNILYEQSISANSEVLVVCSGCTDATEDIVQQYALMDSRLRVYREETRSGKASAMNCILNNATGETILFVSADTLPRKGSFSRLVSRLQDPKVGIVCGNPLPVNSSASLVGKLVQLLWSFHGHVFEALNDIGLARHATEIFCIRRGIVGRIPPKTVNDDAYIAVIAKKKGWIIRYESQSHVLISGPTTFQEYFQQRRRIIFGHYQIRKLTGEAPQYLIHLMPVHPLQTVRMISWLFVKHNPFVIATFLLAEFCVNIFAIGDIILGRNYVQWNALSSTKKVEHPTEYSLKRLRFKQ